jgi:hypothetical protein
MKTFMCALVGSALLALSVSAIADDTMMGKDHMATMMKAMDTNGDGKISKQEFMAYHEKMWDSMKKDSNGMVDSKTMMMHHDAMMKDKGMATDSSSH